MQPHNNDADDDDEHEDNNDNNNDNDDNDEDNNNNPHADCGREIEIFTDGSQSFATAVQQII